MCFGVDMLRRGGLHRPDLEMLLMLVFERHSGRFGRGE